MGVPSRPSARLLAVLAVVEAGCTSPDLGECSVRCNPAGECPAGTACGADDFCHAPGEAASCLAPDGGVDAPGAAPDGADAPGPVPDAAALPPDALTPAPDASAPDGPPAIVVGTVTPCLVGGSVAYLDGAPGEYVHPGTATITAGVWTSPFPTADRVGIHLVPSSTTQGLWWDFRFSSRQLGASLAVGVYEDAEREPFASAGHPGLEVTGDGRGCNTISGRFQIVDLAWSGPTLTSLTATFEQYCDANPNLLRGCVHYQP